MNKQYVDAKSRGITGPCAEDRFGVSFDTDAGVVRLSLSREDLLQFMEAAIGYVSKLQHVCFIESPVEGLDHALTEKQWDAVFSEWNSRSPRRMLTDAEVNDIISRVPQ